MSRYFVYMRNLATGKESYVNDYDTEKDAVKKVSQCYSIDMKSCAAYENYYFIAKR